MMRPANPKEAAVSWDFSTDPDYQRQLDWADAFVREHLWPLESLLGELDMAQLDRAIEPMKDEVRERGLWATHLPRDLGGQGHGQVQLGLLHEILGTCVIAPLAFGNAAPDSGNSEILALAGTPEQKERWLDPLLAGDLRSAFSMTEPHTPGSDPTTLTTRAGRGGDDWAINGPKWVSSNGAIAHFLLVMAAPRPPPPPHQRASMLIVPIDTPGVNILRDVPTMEHPGGHEVPMYGGHAEIVYDDVRVPAGNLLGGEGEGFLISQHRLRPGRVHPRLRLVGPARRAVGILFGRS